MKHWVGIAFNSDEDLVLLNAEGRLYIVDIVLKEMIKGICLPNFPAITGD
jgi:hypothetical protein